MFAKKSEKVKILEIPQNLLRKGELGDVVQLTSHCPALLHPPRLPCFVPVLPRVEISARAARGIVWNSESGWFWKRTHRC
eukprot:199978-Rhodomonas_salina.2